MTERPVLTSSDWVAVFRDQIRALGLTHLEVDARAGLSEGHTSKVMCGMRAPTLQTIERLCRALKIVPVVRADGRSSFAGEP